MRRFVLLAALLAALAGCGDDDGAPDGGDAVQTATAPEPSDEFRIRSTIDGVLTTGDPTLVCERLVTPRYVRDTYGDRTACRQSQTPDSGAKGLRVTDIEVSGDKATAIAIPKGGPTSGVRLRVALVRAGDEWKVDSLRSNAPVGP